MQDGSVQGQTLGQLLWIIILSSRFIGDFEQFKSRNHFRAQNSYQLFQYFRKRVALSHLYDIFTSLLIRAYCSHCLVDLTLNQL